MREEILADWKQRFQRCFQFQRRLCTRLISAKYSYRNASKAKHSLTRAVSPAHNPEARHARRA